MSVVLRALAKIYGVIVWARGWLYDCGVLTSYKSPLPVVSIGNVTAGGNGKTPLCLFVADSLKARGMRPAIVSRGYGGTRKGPHRVTESDRPGEVGDEPVLMARHGHPVYIARRRVKAVKQIEREEVADVIVLDDGLQHRSLCRDVDIVSIFTGTNNAVEDFLKGELLPLGLFREARSKALTRASLVVLSQRKVMSEHELPEPDPRIARVLPPGIEVYRSYLAPMRVISLRNASEIVPSKIAAFAAIANPTGFFESVAGLGFTLGETFAFDDHYQYTEEDVVRMLARAPEGWLVCTEKDAVKLECMPSELLERIGVLRVSARVVPEARFIDDILARMGR